MLIENPRLRKKSKEQATGWMHRPSRRSLGGSLFHAPMAQSTEHQQITSSFATVLVASDEVSRIRWARHFCCASATGTSIDIGCRKADRHDQDMSTLAGTRLFPARHRARGQTTQSMQSSIPDSTDRLHCREVISALQLPRSESCVSFRRWRRGYFADPSGPDCMGRQRAFRRDRVESPTMRWSARCTSRRT